MASKYAWSVTGLLALVVLALGCHNNEPPGTKQARLIAAENRQLNERLSDRDAEIAKLKAQYAKDIEQRDKELAACRKQIETLRADLAKRVDSVMAAVMAENTKLRHEIQELKAKTTNNTP